MMKAPGEQNSGGIMLYLHHSSLTFPISFTFVEGMTWA